MIDDDKPTSIGVQTHSVGVKITRDVLCRAWQTGGWHRSISEPVNYGMLDRQYAEALSADISSLCALDRPSPVLP